MMMPKYKLNNGNGVNPGIEVDLNVPTLERKRKHVEIENRRQLLKEIRLREAFKKENN